jgi:hypothetical protein
MDREEDYMEDFRNHLRLAGVPWDQAMTQD